MRLIRVNACDSWSEEEFASGLEEWVGEDAVPGIAIAQPTTPSGVDFLVVTPYACTIVEIKGVTRAARGVVDIPAGSAWKANGEDLNLHLTGEGPNPIGQVQKYARSFGPRLRQDHLEGAYVDSLVLIVQSREAQAHEESERLRLRDESGLATVADTRVNVAVYARGQNIKGALKYFRQAGLYRGSVWDIPAVHQLFEILEIDSCPTEQELLDEGFERDAGAYSVRYDRRGTALTGASDPTTVIVPRRAYVPPRQPGYQAPSTPSPYGNPPSTWPKPKKSHGPLRAVLLTVMVLMFALLAWPAIWIALDANGGSSNAAEDGTAANSATTFLSPDRNTVCLATTASVRCDSTSVTYDMPSTPARCQSKPNWGHVFVLDAQGTARLECPATRRTAPAAAQSLGYGDRRTVGFITCVSERSGIRCSNGGHGFQTDRLRYDTW
ncbi:nuclease-related domain-containing protein [Luteipulveratus mongoliensis]|uniref:nuclease-related domain-containing protein n=1 Tax=Luteipulveratus mongoliensis TaxID=571913 RepID=UPI000698567D|nr:nuclease-related domain-containing protein [Luteipulveratus mongoliensis]